MLCTLLSVMAIAAAPATRPTEQIRTWFNQLADPSAAVRETAYDQLLGLDSADLPTLRAVVESSVPLRPSQRGVLRQLVQHVFKSGINYDHVPGDEGFIGVSTDIAEGNGVLVINRVQGFPAYRVLRDGDVIQGIEQLPNLRFDGMGVFQEAIRTFHAGDTIVLIVQREGKVLRLPVQLKARPIAAATLVNLGQGVDLNDVQKWEADLQTKADEYWNANFRQFAGEDIS